jgi:hypothetical protein
MVETASGSVFTRRSIRKLLSFSALFPWSRQFTGIALIIIWPMLRIMPKTGERE